MTVSDEKYITDVVAVVGCHLASNFVPLLSLRASELLHIILGDICQETFSFAHVFHGSMH